MSTKEREPLLSNAMKETMCGDIINAEQVSKYAFGEAVGRRRGVELAREFYEAARAKDAAAIAHMEHCRTLLDAAYDETLADAIERVRAKDHELIQQLVDALKVERDDWHRLHDGNCETRRSDDALAAAKAAGFTPTEG